MSDRGECATCGARGMLVADPLGGTAQLCSCCAEATPKLAPTCCALARDSRAVEVVAGERGHRNNVPSVFIGVHAGGTGCVRFIVRAPSGDIAVQSNHCPFCNAYLPGTTAKGAA